jgi:hypothetical protein
MRRRAAQQAVGRRGQSQLTFQNGSIMASPKQRPDRWPGLIALAVGIAIFSGLIAAGVELQLLLPAAGVVFLALGLAILIRLAISDASANQPKTVRLAAALRATFIVVIGVSLVVPASWLRTILGAVGLLVLVSQIVVENRAVRATAPR